MLNGLRRFSAASCPRCGNALGRATPGRMSAEFADTNVVLYLLDDGSEGRSSPRVILGQGPRDQRSGPKRVTGELPPQSWPQLGEKQRPFLEGVAAALCRGRSRISPGSRLQHP